MGTRVRRETNTCNKSGNVRYLVLKIYACLKTERLKEIRWTFCRRMLRDILSALSTNTARQLDILGHDRYALGVDGAEIGVLEQPDQIRLGCFLQRANGRRLEPQISFEILSDFPDQTLEWEFADEQLRRLLVPSDFSQSDGSWPVAMRFLDATSGRGALPRGFGGQLLPRSLASGRLTGGLFSTGHFLEKIRSQTGCWRLRN